jgi:TfoX/Sxy family transcriptional regulator of competence genes
LLDRHFLFLFFLNTLAYVAISCLFWNVNDNFLAWLKKKKKEKKRKEKKRKEKKKQKKEKNKKKRR